MVTQPCQPLALRAAARTRIYLISGARARAYRGHHETFKDLLHIHLVKSRSFPRRAVTNPNAPSDEPSGIWQMTKLLSWLDPGSVAFPDDSFLAEPDSPALDYVMRYPAPTDDDPDHPEYAATAAAAFLLGPDLHGPLEPDGDDDVIRGSGRGGSGALRGRRGGSSMLAQLRQRALLGSSGSEEEEEGYREWQSLDIPRQLLSPRPAAALHSLSSEEGEELLDTSVAVRHADVGTEDLVAAREADRAAHAAAEQVPPELQVLARAANMLHYHTEQGRRMGRISSSTTSVGAVGGGVCGESSFQGAAVAASGGGDAPEPDLGLPNDQDNEEANRFAGICEPLTDEQLAAVAMLVAASSSSSSSSACSHGNCDGGCAEDAGAAAATGPGTDRKAADAGSGGRRKAVAAAAAAALEEEGIEWLDAGRHITAVAAVATGTPEHPGAVTMDLEDRSVQLRRAPCTTMGERKMEWGTRESVAAKAEAELEQAQAHVVMHHAAAEAPQPPKVTYGSTGGFVELNIPVMEAVGGGGCSDGGVEAVTAGGRATMDEAAASVVAEARRAVWGEAGWPYGSLMSADLVEELKSSIRQQQEDAQHGSPSTLLP